MNNKNVNEITKAYLLHQPRLVRYIDYRVRNIDLAQDICQDVFLRLLEYDQLILPQTVKALIYTIANNQIVSHTRSFYHNKMMHGVEVMPVDELHYNNVESHLYCSEISEMELKRVSRLPEKRKEVYVLASFEDYSLPAIAQKLSISYRTAESHLFKSRQQVRAFLRECI
ncbi:MAG TPA: RNA polymerase sigma factor [Paludibacter sp.]|nr:RNA polymerase sigma factor [Paludibacter sp.]